MKWVKRFLLLLACVVVLAGFTGAIVWKRLHGRPAWYPPVMSDPQAREAAARRADQTVNGAMNWAGDAQRRAALASAAKSQPDAPPLDPLTLTFTQDELNAFFYEWDRAYGWSDHYKDYMTDVGIALHDHELILAATMTDADILVGAHLQPELRDGKLQARLRMTGGMLPLPKALWESYRDTIELPLQKKLPALQVDARMQADGSASSALVAASLSEMLLHFLKAEPADPILFLPYLQDFKRRTFPVKVTALSIDGEQLTLTVEPLTNGERQALVSHVREPYASASHGDGRLSTQ